MLHHSSIRANSSVWYVSKQNSYRIESSKKLGHNILPLLICLSFLRLSSGCQCSLPPPHSIIPTTHLPIHIQSAQTHTTTHRALMKWILLYQQCTGHLAQWTAMNNSARREARDEKSGEQGMWRWEGRGVWRTRGNGGTGEVLVCQDASSRGGETQQRNNQDQTCWVNSEAVSVCVSDKTKAPLCCPVQMPVQKHTGTTEPCQTPLHPSFLPLSTLLRFTAEAAEDSQYIVINSWNN